MGDNDLWDEPDWMKEDDEEEDDAGDLSGGNAAQRWNVTDGGVATHYLILLDCHDDMWVKDNSNKNKKSPLARTLSLLQDWVTLQIRESAMYHRGKRNGFGVMLYNTKYRKPKERQKDEFNYQKESGYNESDEDNSKNEQDGNDDEGDDDNNHDDYYNTNRKTTVHELIPMAPPGVSTVKTIRQAIEEEEELKCDYAPNKKSNGSNDDGEDDEDEDQDDALAETCLLELALREAIQMLDGENKIHTICTQEG